MAYISRSVVKDIPEIDLVQFHEVGNQSSGSTGAETMERYFCIFGLAQLKVSAIRYCPTGEIITGIRNSDKCTCGRDTNGRTGSRRSAYGYMSVRVMANRHSRRGLYKLRIHINCGINRINIGKGKSTIGEISIAIILIKRITVRRIYRPVHSSIISNILTIGDSNRCTTFCSLS